MCRKERSFSYNPVERLAIKDAGAQQSNQEQKMKHIKLLNKGFADTWKSVRYIMKYFRLDKSGKAYIFLQVILTILDTLIPLVYLLIPGMVINELSMGRDIGKIVLYVVILAIAPLLNHLKEITLRRVANKRFRALRRVFQNELQSYIADMEFIIQCFCVLHIFFVVLSRLMLYLSIKAYSMFL